MNEDLKALEVTDAEYLKLLADRLRGGLVTIMTINAGRNFIAERLERIAANIGPDSAKVETYNGPG